MTRAGLCAAAGAALALAACGRGAPETQAPVRLFPDVRPFSIGSDTRLGLVLHDQRLSASASLELPDAAELSFGYAVNRAVREEGNEHVDATQLAPVVLSLTLVREDGAREPLFERRLDPKLAKDRRWADAYADLSRWQGETVELEFAMRPDPGGVPPVAAFWEPTVQSAGSRSARPNLIVVSVDTLRARNVGAYGHTRDTTPFLDGLAAAGVLFENAITTAATTAPAHMSLFTGLYPVHHGIRGGDEPRRTAAVPLAVWLRDAGYHTAAFTENGYIIRGLGFGDGFSEYSENTGQGQPIPGEARVTFERARRWVARSRREPFLLFVHTYQVHAPYTPPPETASLFKDDDKPGTPVEELRREHDNYDREIRFVDDQLSGLATALDEHGLRASTAIVVLSDHGEEFGEHGYFQHGSALYEESLRVPLVFSGADIPVGRRVAEQVSLIDVMPTLLELAGVAAPEDLDGQSLLPAMRGESLPERTLFAEAAAPGRWRRPFFREAWNPLLVAVRSQHDKLVVHRPLQGDAAPPERFDLDADALEQAPQPLRGEDLARAQAQIDGYLKGRPSDGANPAPAPEIDPELRKRLEGLGYMLEGTP